MDAPEGQVDSISLVGGLGGDNGSRCWNFLVERLDAGAGRASREVAAFRVPLDFTDRFVRPGGGSKDGTVDVCLFRSCRLCGHSDPGDINDRASFREGLVPLHLPHQVQPDDVLRSGAALVANSSARAKTPLGVGLIAGFRNRFVRRNLEDRIAHRRPARPGRAAVDGLANRAEARRGHRIGTGRHRSSPRVAGGQASYASGQ